MCKKELILFVSLSGVLVFQMGIEHWCITLCIVIIGLSLSRSFCQVDAGCSDPLYSITYVMSLEKTLAVKKIGLCTTDPCFNILCLS